MIFSISISAFLNCFFFKNRCSKNAWIILNFIKRPLLAIALPQSLPVLEMKFTGDTKTYENYVMTSFGMENGILNSLMIYIIKISVSAIFLSILIHTPYSLSKFRFLLVLSPGFLHVFADTIPNFDHFDPYPSAYHPPIFGSPRLHDSPPSRLRIFSETRSDRARN